MKPIDEMSGDEYVEATRHGACVRCGVAPREVHFSGLCFSCGMTSPATRDEMVAAVNSAVLKKSRGEL